MTPKGERMRLVVRSRRVPIGLTEFEIPSYTTQYGVVSKVRRRTVVYGYELKEEERRILEDLRHAAETSGVDLEVIDVGRSGAWSRVFRRLLDVVSMRTRRQLLSSTPEVGVEKTACLRDH